MWRVQISFSLPAAPPAGDHGAEVLVCYWNESHDRLYVGVQAEGNRPAEILAFEAEDY